MDLSIVVPCYNEEDTIELFHDTVANELERPIFSPLKCEIVFVNDGSTDKTLDKAKALAEVDDRVRYVSLSRNFGKESALFAGLEHAQGDYVVIMDADLQDPPSSLPDLYGTIKESEFDLVRFRRVDRKGEPPIRSFFARLFYKLINRVSDIEIVDGARDYQIMSRRAVSAILSMREYNRFFKGMTSWIGFRTCWLEYENVERAAGESKWNFWSLCVYAIDGILAFSTAPLIISSVSGIICFLLAVAMIVFVAVRAALFGDPVTGWPSLVCIILLLGGIQLLSVGVLGQYLSKTYLESKRRPIYLTSESNCEPFSQISSQSR